MKIILTRDVQGTGKEGEIKEVRDGFARNALIPRGFAVEATKANINLLEQKKASAKQKADAEREDAEKIASKLGEKTFRLSAKCGEGGKLFGSVTAKDISAVLKREGFDIDKRKLSVGEIKTYGTYSVEAKLHQGVSAKFNIAVGEEV